MIAVFTYLLEVSLSIALLLIIFIVFFQNTTLFRLNRFYLLISLCLAFAIPAINVPEQVVPAFNNPVNYYSIGAQYEPLLLSEQFKETRKIDLISILATVYVAGLAFFTFRFITGIWRICSARQASDKVVVHGLEVFINPKLSTFSFIDTIFAPSADVHSFIIQHELTHIKERHWIDNFVVEIASIVLWFNPLMMIYKRAVKAQHEFLADQHVIATQSADLESYLKILVTSAADARKYSSISSFGAHPIKARIIMMTKKRTSMKYAIAYTLLLPCVVITLLAFQPPVRPEQRHSEARASENVPSIVPVDPAKIISVAAGFGNRHHPVLNKMLHHNGVDFVTAAGEKIMATADGLVVNASADSIRGNFVTIRHSAVFHTQYFHMQSLNVKTGVKVRKGDVIGYVGNTGLSKNVHLHYEVLKDGSPVNPKEYYQLAGFDE